MSLRMFRRGPKRDKLQSDQDLIQASISLENAKIARVEQERKLEQERESIVFRLSRIRSRMIDHNHVSETISDIIQHREEES
jgi:hypothetical protein